jgi:hypothetical protein
MSKEKTITATIVFQELEGGFWGLIDQAGNQWLPINMPEQLKYAGKSTKVVIREVDMMTTSMWGRPVKIISFSTFTP